jgi:hypothetical protein
VFQCTTDNEKIKAIYGNYGFWSWLRYWHLDSADFVLLMLMDKGYYDYDYSAPEKKQPCIVKPKNKEELNSMMARFGFRTKLRTPDSKPLTPAELQAEVMAEEKKKRAAPG